MPPLDLLHQAARFGRRTAASLILLSFLVPEADAQSYRIGTRVVNGRGEFYDRVTGEKFVPRGNNLVRTGRHFHYDNRQEVVSEFFFEEQAYNPEDAETQLTQMQAFGYNTVRVFVGTCCAGSLRDDTDPSRLRPAYLANVADFTRRARQHSIQVLLSFAMNGNFGPYRNDWLTSCCTTFAGPQIGYLTAGGTRANARLFQDFVRGLARSGAAFDSILGYDVRNEISYDLTVQPLTFSTGTIATGNGRSYDMADLSQKRRMMDENMVHYLSTVADAIHEVSPAALVGVSLAVPKLLLELNWVTPDPVSVINDSRLDFVDVHAHTKYLFGLTADETLEDYGIERWNWRKPVIVGEYGTHSASPAEDAVEDVLGLQLDTCKAGISGWTLFRWDPLGPDIPNSHNPRWTAIQDDHLLNRALAPKYRPDPCSAGRLSRLNIARGKTVTASTSNPDFPPSLVVDGKHVTRYISSGRPPQWLEIDLGTEHPIGKIALVISQGWPATESHHKIWARRNLTDTPQLIHEFKGVTEDQQTLEHEFPPTSTAWRYLRIETVAPTNYSVAWREVSVFPPAAGDPYRPDVPLRGAILNAASFEEAVSPGSWVSIFGANLAASTRNWTGKDFQGDRLPTTLDGVSVLIDNKPAAISYVSPTQLNVQLPDVGSTMRTVPLQVNRPDAPGDPIPIRVQPYAPGLFTYTAEGTRYVSAVHLDATLVGDPAKVPGARPARAGERLLLYGTGFGPAPAGSMGGFPAVTPAPVEVNIGGKPALVEFAGSISPGLVQINVIVPDLAAGDHPVTATISRFSTQNAVLLPVR